MKNTWKLFACIAGGAVGVWLTAKLLLPVGLPFLCGWALAGMARPMERVLTVRAKVPQRLASFLCITLLSAAICAAVWLLARLVFSEAEHLTRRIPALLSSLAKPLSGLHAWLLRMAAKLPDPAAAVAAQWLERLFAGGAGIAESLSGGALALVGRVISRVPHILLFLMTALLSAYLISSEREKLALTARRHIPAQWYARGKKIAKRLKSALGGYVKAQLRLSLVVLAVSGLGLLLLRQKNAAALAVVIALVDALPVFGAGTILIPWGVLSFLRGEASLGAGMLVLYALCAVGRAFLEPRFLGKQIGLDPLMTLAALYAGFRLFGILGMILLPVAVILLKQLYELVCSAEQSE